ncbi:hypothetical protein Q0M94_24220 (plasmid) [Deinococcus radiomollis]|uniref:hypothetical protein n=1 Tax=Deinococcus radiomollis TaxID=468916 RepID=UPI003892C04F
MAFSSSDKQKIISPKYPEFNFWSAVLSELGKQMITDQQHLPSVTQLIFKNVEPSPAEIHKSAVS